jgi:hypothetical protein
MVKFMGSIDQAGAIDLTPPDPSLVYFSTWNYFRSRLGPITDKIELFSENVKKWSIQQ